MSFQCPESREQDQVKINFALVLPGRLTLFISGIAANENSDFVQSGLEDGKAFIEQHDPNFILHIDLSTLDFCYSSVVKVFTSFLMTPMRPVVELALGKQMWQQTSMKMLAQMSPNCSVVQPAAPAAPASDASSSEAGAIEAATPAAPVYCQHTDTRTDEDHFFAPTGNGSIVTMIICTQCGRKSRRCKMY